MESSTTNTNTNTTTNTNNNTTDQEEEYSPSNLFDGGEISLGEALTRSAALISTNPRDAIANLQTLQSRIASLSIFSSNESIDDIPTSSLSLLAAEFHLGMAYLAALQPPHQQAGNNFAKERMRNVIRSADYFHAFLRRLEHLDGLLPKEVVEDYHSILDKETDELDENNETGGGGGGGGEGRRRTTTTNSTTSMDAARAREAKIARYRRKKAAEEQVSRLRAMRERRARLGVEANEEVDGYDEDGLERNMISVRLNLYATEAMDELLSAQREMDMLRMAVQMEERREEMERYVGGRRGGKEGHNGRLSEQQQHKAPPQPSNKPLQVTHITQNPLTGQLHFEREEIKSQVFRPGWNQPTMTLRELGDMERAQALEREEKQRVAEREALMQPRRYEQLVRDGMEDNADLVDASAALDREWDAFKEENPRGSGNKMGDRGDRNF